MLAATGPSYRKIVAEETRIRLIKPGHWYIDRLKTETAGSVRNQRVGMNSRRRNLNVLLINLLSVFFVFFALPDRAISEDWSPLADRLIKDGFDEASIRALFSSPDLEYDPMVMTRKIESLIRAKYFRPPPTPGAKKTTRIYKSFENPRVIDGAFAFLKENSKMLEQAQSRYGVPKEIIVSILLVETKLGEYMGNRKAFNTLASMALSRDLGKIKPHVSPGLLTERTEGFAAARCASKADWAYGELKALIRHGMDGSVDLLNVPGSIYGAIGLCQFMPSQISLHGVDADGNGKIDLFTRADAFLSVANYLKNNGWKAKMTRKQQVKVIYAYNHSMAYANTVLFVAQRLSEKQAQEPI